MAIRLRVGMIGAGDANSNSLYRMLVEQGIELAYTLLPKEITEAHINETALDVWLLDLDDAQWHNNLDALMDRTTVPIFFNEHNSIEQQAHAEYWVRNLITRMEELVDDVEMPVTPKEKVKEKTKENDAQNASPKSVQTPAVVNPQAEVKVQAPPQKQVPSQIQVPPQKQSEQQVAEAKEISAASAAVNPQAEKPSAKPSPISSSETNPSAARFAPERSNALFTNTPDPMDSIASSKEGPADAIVSSPTHIDPELMREMEELESLLAEKDPSQKIDAFKPLEPIRLVESTPRTETFTPESKTAPVGNPAPENNRVVENQNAVSDALSEIKTPVAPTVEQEPKPITQKREEKVAKETAPVVKAQTVETDIGSLNPESVASASGIEAKPETKLEEKLQEKPKAPMSSEAQTQNELASQRDAETVKKPALDIMALLKAAKTELTSDDIKDRRLKRGESDLPGSNTFVSESNTAAPESVPPPSERIENKTESAHTLQNLLGDEAPETSTQNHATEVLRAKADTPVLTDDDVSVPVLNTDSSRDEDTFEIIFDDVPSLNMEVLGESDFIEELSDARSVDDSAVPVRDEEILEEIPTLNVENPASFEFGDEVSFEDLQEETEKFKFDSDVSEDIPTLRVDETTPLKLDESDAEVISFDEIEFEDVADTSNELSHEVENQKDPSSFDQESIKPNLVDIDEDGQRHTHSDAEDSDPVFAALSEEELAVPMLESVALGEEFELLPDLEEAKDVGLNVKVEAKLPCDLWVIGASLGGPAALKRFFAAITQPLPVSFLIAQHIDPHFLPVLAKIVEGANPFYKVELLSRPGLIEPGTILLAPVEKRLWFLDGAQVVHSPHAWTPPYSPCINDVLLDIAKAYPKQAHAIIFSGMGEDGIDGAKALHASGGKIWVQEAESCASSVMPDAIFECGIVSLRTTPEKLAQTLMERYLQHNQSQSN